MAKKRAEPDANEAEEEAGPSNRREGMAQIARKRAAHFANFQDEGDDADENIHAGGDQARTLGPWSSAMELVNAREKAQHERQAKLQAAAGTEQEGEAEADAAAEWRPSRDPALGPHPRDPVKPLFGHCLDVLTAYIDCVESLWGVPDAIKVRLAAHVCARRKMSPEAARLFATSAPTEVLVPDCTQLDAPAMADLLREVTGPSLQRLELGFCGRGFGDDAAALVVAVAGGPLAELESLTLDGAYRLSDAGLIKLLSAAPALRRLSLAQGSRFTSALLDKLPELVPQLTHLNLADCRGLGAESLAAALPRLQQLRSVRLDLIPEVDDGVLVALATKLPHLTELSLRCCQAVTDAGLRALAASGRGPHLELLRIDECGGRVTDAGLAALASQCRALKVFSARRCTKLGDEALAELLRAGGCCTHLCLSGVAGVGPAVAAALAGSCRGSLEELDVSFCRKLPDRCLGLVLERCAKLRRLAVFGCSQLSAASLYGHTNAALVIEGMHTKVDLDLGLAQKRAAAVAGGGEGQDGEEDAKERQAAAGADKEDGGGEGDAEGNGEEERGGGAAGGSGGAAAAGREEQKGSPEGKEAARRGKKAGAQGKKAAAAVGEANAASTGRKRRAAGDAAGAGAGPARPRGKVGKKGAAAAPVDEALEAAKEAPPQEEWF